MTGPAARRRVPFRLHFGEIKKPRWRLKIGGSSGAGGFLEIRVFVAGKFCVEQKIRRFGMGNGGVVAMGCGRGRASGQTDCGRSGLFIRGDGFYGEDEIDQVQRPDNGQDGAADDDAFPAHYDEADAHEQAHGGQDAHFGFPGHAFSGCEVLQVVLVEPGAFEPAVQPFRGPGEAEGRQHQKGKGGEDGQHRSRGPEGQADAAEDDIERFFQGVPPVVFSP